MQIMPLNLVSMHFINNLNSSAKAGDYESCDAENTANRCLICDADVKRLKKIDGSNSYCSCQPGYIDVLFTCLACDYTW